MNIIYNHLEVFLQWQAHRSFAESEIERVIYLEDGCILIGHNDTEIGKQFLQWGVLECLELSLSLWQLHHLNLRIPLHWLWFRVLWNSVIEKSVIQCLNAYCHALTSAGASYINELVNINLYVCIFHFNTF